MKRSIEMSSATTWLRPKIGFFGRSWSLYQLCGVIGLMLGTCLASLLARQSGLAPVIVLFLLLTGVLTFLALAMATKIVTGRENLVYYHHEVAVLTVSTILLSVLGLPVLPYLDVTVLGLGTFLVWGRCGCLMVGCCHGKPHSRGVRYGAAHVAEGFPECYLGTRLFPVQALESSIVLVIVVVGSLFVLSAQPAGTALSWYVVSYSAVRIWLEELRGDGDRPYRLGLSEAQWTSLVLLIGVLASEWLGRLPLFRWHFVVCAVTVLATIVLALRRRESRAFAQARHVGEIASIVAALPSTSKRVDVRRTSLTVGLSRQSFGRHGAHQTVLYSLSRADRELTVREARELAKLIGRLASRAGASWLLLRGRYGVFHVIFHPSSEEKAS